MGIKDIGCENVDWFRLYQGTIVMGKVGLGEPKTRNMILV
jgi:hypothetical protein